jgi:hypothetical protein
MNRLVVAIAHNYDPGCNTANYNVVSPGKAWNVLTVGAYNDQAPALVSAFSRYLNPSTGNEKPEVVAPGEGINGIGMNGVPLANESGTSFAAPHVTGLSLLLMNRDSTMFAWPESLRASIMASADYNIEGSLIVDPSLPDQKDGAGAINAAWADSAAMERRGRDNTCLGSCWGGWSIDRATFPVWSNQYLYFQAQQGQRVRAVIAWDSHPDSNCAPNSCATDELLIDLDLFAECCSGNGYVGPAYTSVSAYNNYEMVEFAAPQTGTYRLRIYKPYDQEPYTSPFPHAYMGVAILKTFALYMP